MEEENRSRIKVMAEKIGIITGRVIQDKKESLIRKRKSEACKGIKAKGSWRLQEVASPAPEDALTTILVKQTVVHEIAARKNQQANRIKQVRNHKAKN